jgi:hypothetical protein
VIIWTLRAERHLRQALAERLCSQGSQAVAQRMQELGTILECTFRTAATVVVLDQFVSFRRREDEFILLVEVRDGDEAQPFVVKISPHDRLQRDIDGWNSCRPPGLRHDLVLMTLEPRHHDAEVDGSQCLISLVYSDAQQFIGVETTTTLEAAVLGAVHHGTPSPASVGVVLAELFERIGHLLYTTSFVEKPAQAGCVFLMPSLAERLDLWEQRDVAVGVRRDVNTFALAGRGQFRDPVEYLCYVRNYVPWDRTEDEPPSPAGPPPELLIPRMLRGHAHGDLHGRNVLVGIVHNRALWPAVFDYGHMGPLNFLGWDFVKLETELKVRAYPELFHGGSVADFIRAVQHFEIELTERTEANHRTWNWPVVSDEKVLPAERLQALLLAIRHQAAVHLGLDRSRPYEWLDEYYFLLMCYGVSVVRFDNLLPRQRLGAYLSAGVAAARFLWGREPLLERTAEEGGTP